MYEALMHEIFPEPAVVRWLLCQPPNAAILARFPAGKKPKKRRRRCLWSYGFSLSSPDFFLYMHSFAALSYYAIQSYRPRKLENPSPRVFNTCCSVNSLSSSWSHGDCVIVILASHQGKPVQSPAGSVPNFRNSLSLSLCYQHCRGPVCDRVYTRRQLGRANGPRSFSACRCITTDSGGDILPRTAATLQPSSQHDDAPRRQHCQERVSTFFRHAHQEVGPWWLSAYHQVDLGSIAGRVTPDIRTITMMAAMYLLSRDSMALQFEKDVPVLSREVRSTLFPELDSTVMCILEPRMFGNWLLPHKVASITSRLAVWLSLLVSLQVCYWLRVVQGVSNKLRSNYKVNFSVHVFEIYLVLKRTLFKTPLEERSETTELVRDVVAWRFVRWRLAIGHAAANHRQAPLPEASARCVLGAQRYEGYALTNYCRMSLVTETKAVRRRGKPVYGEKILTYPGNVAVLKKKERIRKEAQKRKLNKMEEREKCKQEKERKQYKNKASKILHEGKQSRKRRGKSIFHRGKGKTRKEIQVCLIDRKVTTTPQLCYSTSRRMESDLPWRILLVRHRAGVRKALGSNPGQDMDAYECGAPTLQCNFPALVKPRLHEAEKYPGIEVERGFSCNFPALVKPRLHEAEKYPGIELERGFSCNFPALVKPRLHEAEKYPGIEVERGFSCNFPALVKPRLHEAEKYPGIEVERGFSCNFPALVKPRLHEAEKYPGIEVERGFSCNFPALVKPRLHEAEKYPGIELERGFSCNFPALVKPRLHEAEKYPGIELERASCNFPALVKPRLHEAEKYPGIELERGFSCNFPALVKPRLHEAEEYPGIELERGFSLFLAVAIPLDEPYNDVAFSWNYEANYVLPYNASELSQYGYARRETRSLKDLTRTTAYHVLRNKFQSQSGREIPEKTRRPTASSGTIPTCEKSVTRPGIEPGSPWWEAARLTAQPPCAPPPPPDHPDKSGFCFCFRRASDSTINHKHNFTKKCQNPTIVRRTQSAGWGRGGVLVRLLASHLAERGSFSGRVTPGFSRGGIVPDDAAGRRVFSGSSRFTRLFVPALLRIHLASPSVETVCMYLAGDDNWVCRACSHGYDGETCLLKAICEAAATPMKGTSMIADILHVVFTNNHQRPGNFADSSAGKLNCIHVCMCVCSSNNEPARKIRTDLRATWSGVKLEQQSNGLLTDARVHKGLWCLACRRMNPRNLRVSHNQLDYQQDEPGLIPGWVTLDFRKWESCRAMPLVGGGFFRGSPVSLAIAFLAFVVNNVLNRSTQLNLRKTAKIAGRLTHPDPVYTIVCIAHVPSTSVDEGLDPEYLLAEQMGKEGEECEDFYEDCPLSLMTLMKREDYWPQGPASHGNERRLTRTGQPPQPIRSEPGCDWPKGEANRETALQRPEYRRPDSYRTMFFWLLSMACVSSRKDAVSQQYGLNGSVNNHQESDHADPRMERSWDARAGKREYLEKTRRQAASSSTIPTCENPGAKAPPLPQPVGTKPHDAAGRWVSLGISRFLRPCIPALLYSHLISPSSALKTSMLRAAQISLDNYNVWSVAACTYMYDRLPITRRSHHSVVHYHNTYRPALSEESAMARSRSHSSSSQQVPERRGTPMENSTAMFSENGAALECEGGEMGDPRENPPTIGNILYYSGSDPAGD
ncbi:hypothetical protein PR048_003821 [Dryococelus australis]|uniref:Uncharacterized protein n=1 Tax=Dryococelus australis TaxID=614101 RepID=A0ABQ9IPY4_9NEOP|nr:hypothetical protein PR048_003821 [Dryococelus australis]